MFRAYAIHFLKTNRNLRFAAVLLLTLVVLCGAIQWMIAQVRWTAFDIPLDTSKPIAMQQAFTAQLPFVNGPYGWNYVTNVYTPTKYNADQPLLPDEQSTHVTVTRAGRSVEVNFHGFSYDHPGIRLNSFKARRGQHYIVAVQVKKVPSDWKRLPLHLRVYVPEAARHEQSVAYAGLYLFAFFFGIAGAIHLMTATLKLYDAWHEVRQMHRETDA